MRTGPKRGCQHSTHLPKAPYRANGEALDGIFEVAGGDFGIFHVSCHFLSAARSWPLDLRPPDCWILPDLPLASLSLPYTPHILHVVIYEGSCVHTKLRK